ncbi:hypothetical protein [Gordonia sp. NPDC003376]
MAKSSKRAALIIGMSCAAIGLVSTPAHAESTDQYDAVQYQFCGNNDVAELEFTNKYGNSQKEFVDMSDGCRYYRFTETDEYGGFASASVTDEDGGAVSCTIWVNGRVVAKSNDNSEYYSWASCY